MKDSPANKAESRGGRALHFGFEGSGSFGGIINVSHKITKNETGKYNEKESEYLLAPAGPITPNLRTAIQTSDRKIVRFFNQVKNRLNIRSKGVTGLYGLSRL